jgi:hypothetical protein
VKDHELNPAHPVRKMIALHLSLRDGHICERLPCFDRRQITDDASPELHAHGFTREHEPERSQSVNCPAGKQIDNELWKAMRIRELLHHDGAGRPWERKGLQDK